MIAEQLRSLNICLVISVYFKYIICNNHMNHTTARKRNREHTDLNGFHLVSLKYNIILIDTSLRDAAMALFLLIQHRERAYFYF